MKRLFIIVLAIIGLSCSTFSANWNPETQGYDIKESGAPLLTRSANFSVNHQWLDKEGVLHEIKITRNSDENSDGQSEAIKALASIIQSGMVSKTVSK